MPLRQGDRMLGGALTWQQPLKLAPFDPDGPFAGLPTPEDARVSRQALAEPTPNLSAATLATLEDGTPSLHHPVAARQGAGSTRLSTPRPAMAGARCRSRACSSTCRLLGIMDLAPGAGGTPKGSVEPSMVLDAFGRLNPLQGCGPADPGREPGRHAAGTRPPARPLCAGHALPPPAGSDEQPARLALNLQPAVPQLVPLDRATLGLALSPWHAERLKRKLGPWLLSVALLLALADLLDRLNRDNCAA